MGMFQFLNLKHLGMVVDRAERVLVSPMQCFPFLDKRSTVASRLAAGTTLHHGGSHLGSDLRGMLAGSHSTCYLAEQPPDASCPFCFSSEDIGRREVCLP